MDWTAIDKPDKGDVVTHLKAPRVSVGHSPFKWRVSQSTIRTTHKGLKIIRTKARRQPAARTLLGPLSAERDNNI